MLAQVIFRVTGGAEFSSFLLFFPFLSGGFFLIVRVMRYTLETGLRLRVYAGKILPGQPV